MRQFQINANPEVGALVLLLVLENADVSPSELWNKIRTGQSDSLFAAEAQKIEHEHDSPELWTYLKASCCKLQGRRFPPDGPDIRFFDGK
jgi:hypothetical protein